MPGMHDVDRDRSDGAASSPAAVSGVSAPFRSMLFALRRTLAKVMKLQGATWGATADNFQAMLSHCQPLSSQLDTTSGDARTPPATHRWCLLSSGSRVRILPGALTCGFTCAVPLGGWAVIGSRLPG